MNSDEVLIYELQTKVWVLRFVTRQNCDCETVIVHAAVSESKSVTKGIMFRTVCGTFEPQDMASKNQPFNHLDVHTKGSCLKVAKRYHPRKKSTVPSID